MNDSLDTRIRQLVQELHDAAPAAPDWDRLDAATIPDRPHRRSRVASWGAVAAAVVTIVAVAAVIGVRTDRHAQPGPDVTSAPAAPTSAPATSASPVETTSGPPTTAPEPASTSTSVSTSVDVPVTGPAITSADVDAQRKAALAGFDSVAFTAVVTETYDGHSDMDSQRTNDVTLLNDGSLWATGDMFLFNSYDPATGTAKAAFRQLDGTTGYQEVVGWTDNSTPLMVMLGSLDPTGPVGGPGLTITGATVGGRAQWRVEQTTGGPTPSGRDMPPQTTVWTIDRATGLVVAYEQEWSYNDQGERARRTVTLSDIHTGVDLPAEFPGSFPDGATVDRSGSPVNGPVTLGEAAAAFGDRLVAPAASAVQPQITMIESPAQLSTLDGEQDPPTTTISAVTFTYMDGFVRTTVELIKTFVPDTGVPDGYAAVGDALCHSVDGVTCDELAGNLTLSAGAWAGTPATAEGSTISMTRQGVQLTISAASPDAALQLAESLATPT